MARSVEIDGAKLKKEIEAKGYSLPAASQLIGCSRSFFTTTIAGGRIGPDKLKTIHAFLGIAPEAYTKAERKPDQIYDTVYAATMAALEDFYNGRLAL